MVTELRILEHLKLPDEHGDAERVPPPDPVADQGQPHWYQDFLSFVPKGIYREKKTAFYGNLPKAL